MLSANKIISKRNEIEKLVSNLREGLI